MWPYILSDRLLIVALVGRYPANWLIRRGSILYRIAPFPYAPCSAKGLCGISSRFQLLSPCAGQVIHALLTRPPLSRLRLPPEGFCRRRFVRLACVRLAASVHPEPGSNSHLNVCFLTGSRLAFALLFPVRFTFSWVHLSLTKDDSFSEISIEFSGLFHCLVVKVHLLQTIHITLGLLFHCHFSSMRQRMISYHIFFCLSTLFFKRF